MAVVVGTAQGKLTLDASRFIANIDSSYKALKKFNDLIEDTQKSLNNLPNKTIDLGINGLTGSDFNLPKIDLDPDDSLGMTTGRVEALTGALSKGLMGALKGVGTLAEVTFKGFEKYTQFVVDFSKQSLEVGQQFDATMSQVGAISGATGEDFDALREKALEMGAATKFSASEAGQALVYMGMAGWKTEDMLDGIEGIMSLSAASGEDLATTSDIVTDALTAFGLEAKDAAHFSDVLAAASTNSNTNVALMGETFKYVAPLAGTMKYGIEDTAIAIGLMANSGIKSSQAGTALRNILTRLADPPKEAAKAMTELGLSLTRADGSSKDFMEVMIDLRKAFADVTNDKTMEEYRGWLELYNKQLEEGAISQEEYERNINEIATMFLKSTDTIKAGLASDIAGKFGLSGLLAIVGASDEDFQKLTESIYGASEGMGAANEMSEKMMDNLTGSVTIFKSTLETFQITISDLLKGPANELVKFGQQSIAKMTDAMTSEGIPGLIKAIGRIIPEGINQIVQYIPQVLPSLMEGFWTLVNSVIDSIPTALPIVVDGAMTLFMGLAEGLAQASQRILPMIPEIINTICDSIDSNADDFIEAAFTLFLNLIDGIIKAMPKIIQTVAKLIRKIISAIREHLPEILTMGIELILALIEGLLDPETIKSLILAIADIIKVILDTFDGVDWLETADKIFSGLGEGLLGIFEGALGAIDELLGTNFASWAQEVGKFMGYLKEQSFEFGKSLAESMNKTDIELNELQNRYSGTYREMLNYYAELVKSGSDAQKAMAEAYQKYFTSAEAQYVFKERFAGSLTGTSTLANTLGTSDMSNQQLVDLLSRTSAATGNTYNFYSNEPIDEKKAADEIRKVNSEILQQ